MKNIKSYNESLKDKLKGKTNDELMTSIKDMDILDRIKKIKQHNLGDEFMPSEWEIRQHFNSSYGTKSKAFVKAMEIGYLPVIREFIADVMTSDYQSYTHHYYDAIKNGYLDILKLLIARKLNTLDKSFLVRLLSHSRYEKKPIIEEYLRQVIRDRYSVNIIYESLKDKLKGKSEEEILGNIKNLSIQKQFEKACEYGLLSVVKELIEDVYDPSSNNNHAIDIATSKGQIEIVKELLKDKRVDPTQWNNAAIRLSSRYGHLDVVKELMKDNRIDPSDQNNNAIKAASERGFTEIVKELLKDQRVDPLDRNMNPKINLPSYKFNALQLAIEKGHTEIIKLLEEHIKNKNINESLKDKIKGKSNEELNQQLLKLHTINRIRKIRSLKLDDSFLPSDEEIKNTLLRYDTIEHIKILKEFGLSDKFLPSDEKVLSEINKSNDPPDLLVELIKTGYSKFVKFIVDIHFLTIEGDGIRQDWLNYGLKHAFKNAKLKIVEYFLDIGADIESLLSTKIDVYVSPNKKEKLRKIYYKYKNMNESLRDKLKGKSKEDVINSIEHLSPVEQFEKACKYGILLIVKKLIEDGHNPAKLYNIGLSEASEKGHTEIVKELLKDGRIDPAMDNNWAIGIASSNGHSEVVKELMKDKRVDPSDNDNYAIGLSSRSGHVDIVKELLKDKRVDPSANDNYVIKIAEEKGHTEIVNLLKQHIGLNESLRDKLKGKSADDIKRSLGIINDYISVKIWNPNNHLLVSDKFKLKEERLNPVYTKVSGDFMTVLDFMMNYNSNMGHNLALIHFKNSIIKNDN